MNEQQQHLQQVLEQQKEVLAEISALNSQVSSKREVAFKLQGVIEYLQQTGVSLDGPETTEE